MPFLTSVLRSVPPFALPIFLCSQDWEPAPLSELFHTVWNYMHVTTEH